MSGFKDHFSGHAASYAQARPRYPDTLFDWLSTQCAEHALAWDVGCGNGQASVALAARFARVLATDPSATQIANAEPHARVHYAVEPAEACSLPAASADLITVAQALHWFDFARFFAEVARVLKPRGVLAAWSYGVMRVAPEIDAVLDDFEHGIVGPYWPPERRHVDEGYRGIAMPFDELVVPEFAMQLDWRLDQVLDYLATWSAVQRYRQARGEDPMPALRARLTEVWGAPDAPRVIRWPLIFRATRKP